MSPSLLLQQNFLGSLGGLSGAVASIQVDFRTADGRPVQYATVKGKGPELEKHPLFSSHDTVMGDVRLLHSIRLMQLYWNCSSITTSARSYGGRHLPCRELPMIT